MVKSAVGSRKRIIPRCCGWRVHLYGPVVTRPHPSTCFTTSSLNPQTDMPSPPRKSITSINQIARSRTGGSDESPQNGSHSPPQISEKGKMKPTTCHAVYHAGSNHSMGVIMPASIGRYNPIVASAEENRTTNLFWSKPYTTQG